MPKRGGNSGGNFRRNRGGGAWNGDHQDNRYNEHDNRDRTTKVQRRVSFKPTNNRIGGNGKISDIKIRAQFEDGDDDMGHIQTGAGNNSRGNFTKGRGFRRRGSPIPGRSGGFGGPKKLERGQHDWFQVRIPHGAKYDKNFILKSLTDCVAPEPLITYYFGKDEKTQSIFFFVDDDRLAEALLRADRKVALPNGFRMQVNVRSDVPRVPPLDDTFKQVIKMAMVKRYNKDTNALNLEKFYCDPDLTLTFCPLFRPQIMMAVIDIIAENIPGLSALNLNNNKLILHDHFKNLAEKLPHLRILYLKQNKISNINSLDNLKGLPLTELVLENNPIRDRKDETYYISEVRSRFPKLVKLDEKVLPPTIGFDVESDIKLPVARASFLSDHNGAEIVRQFLEQYFLIFDSGNRQPLLDAYHEHAMFSMTANPTQHPVNLTRLNAYCSASRNLLQTRDNNFRVRALKYGRLPVVSFLSELPATKHDPQTFVVDLTIFTPVLLCLTVTGVFKECRPSSNSEHFRSFQRTLVIVPAGSGFCIRNEVLHINFASPIQERFAFKPLPPPAPVVQLPPPVMHGGPLPTILEASAAGVGGGLPDDTTKMQMVQAMCATSQMNAEWSRKCLEEHQWDYQRAGETFTRLHSQNKIPPEAFVK